MVTARKILLVVGLPTTLLGVLALAPSPARERVSIAGTFTMAYVKRERIQIPDAEGHVLMVAEARGSNRNTGPTDFMSASEAIVLEALDLVQGNGSTQGYVIQAKHADSVFVATKGRVATTMSSQGSPSTSFEGDWTVLKAAGQYQGIKGSGTFKGRFTSPTEYTVDWKGEYSR